MDYLSFKKKEILTCVTLTNLKDVMLSEISQTQNTNTAWSYLYVETTKVELTVTEGRMVVTTS